MSFPPRKPAHGRRPPSPSHPRPGTPGPAGKADRGWDNVATWYDKLVGDSGSDYHQNVILPATKDLLQVSEGERVLDLCCGQGVLAPLVTAAGAHYTGVDASPKLIESARKRIRHANARFLISDVTKPASWADGSYDAVACLMAVHDVPLLDQMFANLSNALIPGGRAILIFMHPCFRIPRQSHWGWDEEKKIQYRRLDRYGVPLTIPIQTHPGLASEGHTQFHHRPLAAYINELGAAGMAVIGCEELYSHRRSQAGPRSRGEHRAAEEFPLFLALLAVKAGGDE